MPPNAAKGKRIIRKRRRKSFPCGEGMLNSYAGDPVCSNSQRRKNGGILDMHQHTIGEDGHYYECVICDNSGKLLCCDTCPNTYHLQCLDPPLEEVPPGNWKCSNCYEQEDLEKPISHLRSSGSKKNMLTSKVLHDELSPSLLEIDDAGHLAKRQTVCQENAFGEEEQSTAKHIDDGKGTATRVKIREPRVYQRRYRSKKAIIEREDINSTKSIRVHESSEMKDAVHREPITPVSRFLNSPGFKSVCPEQADKELEVDFLTSKRPNLSLEQRINPVNEQGGDTEQLPLNAEIAMRHPNKSKTDKLLILRDVMQESTKSNDKMLQDYNKAWGYHKYTKIGLAHKEKFTRLRMRQKIRLSLRNTCGRSSTISGTFGAESFVQLYTAKFIKGSGFHASTNDLKNCTTLGPLLAMNKVSDAHQWHNRYSDHSYNHKNHARDRYLESHLRVPYCWQNKIWGQLPASSLPLGSSAGFCANMNKNRPEISMKEFLSVIQNPNSVPQGTLSYPSKVSTSTFSSVFSLGKGVNHMTMGRDNFRKELGMVEAWFEEELDSLWIGVRRHGQGNWESILRDPTLKFSKHRTPEDLSERWKKERQQILMMNLPGAEQTISLPGSQILKPNKLIDAKQCFRDVTGRSMVSSSSIAPLHAENSTLYEPPVPFNFLTKCLQQPISIAAGQSQILLKEMYSFPGPLQTSKSTPGARKNSKTGLLRIRPDVSSTSSENPRQTHLLGGSFHLSGTRMDRNQQKNDSSETESDPSLAERHEEEDLSQRILDD